MKNLLLVLIFLVVSSVRAQITLEHDYISSPGSQSVSVVNLSSAGSKYMIFTPPMITLYNLDHSIYKTINLPAPAGARVYPGSYFYISETLFNNDSLIELKYGAQDTTNFSIIYPQTIINENGTVLGSYPLGTISVYNVGGSVFKMSVQYMDTTGGSVSSSHTEIYSLPGTLPCNACGGFTGIAESAGRTSSSSVSPNPSRGKITIKYDLDVSEHNANIQVFNEQGQMVKSYNVNSGFNDLIIESNSFSPGLYFYSIIGKRERIGGKFIVQ